ncbi:MAG: hypothetical protein GF331_19960 [Chitinivibrionales bacterium]|nr:hypothetical protein [Chitinivibrionales bacterium]
MGTSAEGPLPLSPNTYRSYDQITWYQPQFTVPGPIFSPQSISVAIANRTWGGTNDYLGNRLIAWFADSIDFGKIWFNFRIRIDQHGREAGDVGYLSDEGGSFTYDPDRIVMDWRINDHVHLRFGKDRFNWGPLKLGGLLVSDYNQGYNMLWQKYTLGPFVLKGFSTQLNNTPWQEKGDPEIPDSVTVYKRYFSASRLELYREYWGVALAQAIIYSGENRSFEIPYLLPFYPYHYGQLSVWREGNNNENTYGALDFYAKLIRKQLTLYGEILVDDFQGETDARSQSVQNAIGYMFGAELAVGETWHAFVEGGKINSFVYNHVAGARLRYLNEHSFIGSPLGPDQVLVWGKVGRWLLPAWRLSAMFWVLGSGERSVGYEYDSELLHTTRDDVVPYGTVEWEQLVWLRNELSLFTVGVCLDGGVLRYTNKGHIEREESVTPFVSLTVRAGVRFGGRGDDERESVLEDALGSSPSRSRE